MTLRPAPGPTTGGAATRTLGLIGGVITLRIGEADVNVPVFDTTRLHAEAAMAFALGGDVTLPAAERTQSFFP